MGRLGDRKTGGRQKGTPNQKTVELQARLSSLGLDPIQGLKDVLPSLDAQDQAHVYLGLMPYLYPKRKSIEMSVEDSQRLSQIKTMEGMAPQYLKELLKKALLSGDNEIEVS